MSLTETNAEIISALSEIGMIALRLAEEGVPVRAIARCLQSPCEQVYEVLKGGMQAARIVEMPPDDWPPTQKRSVRLGSGRHAKLEDSAVVMELMRGFKVSKQQAFLLNVLLKKKLATKDALYEAAQAVHAVGNETEPKIVDVVICKLRKRLAEYGFKIETIWGGGYFIAVQQRRDIYRTIGLDGFVDDIHDALDIPTETLS